MLLPGWAATEVRYKPMYKAYSAMRSEPTTLPLVIYPLVPGASMAMETATKSPSCKFWLQAITPAMHFDMREIDNIVLVLSEWQGMYLKCQKLSCNDHTTGRQTFVPDKWQSWVGKCTWDKHMGATQDCFCSSSADDDLLSCMVKLCMDHCYMSEMCQATCTSVA